MIDYQQKRKINKVIYSKVTLLVLLIIVIFLGKATFDVYQKSKLSSDNYASVFKDYNGLKDRKAMLDSEITRLKTDAGMEEEIRSKFSVAKPGETVVVVINSTSGSSTDSQNNKNSFWNFFGWFK